MGGERAAQQREHGRVREQYSAQRSREHRVRVSGEIARAEREAENERAEGERCERGGGGGGGGGARTLTTCGGGWVPDALWPLASQRAGELEQEHRVCEQEHAEHGTCAGTLKGGAAIPAATRARREPGGLVGGQADGRA
eukprot:scaffold99631_cov18-Tisochrysis_lutea.AAC.2